MFKYSKKSKKFIYGRINKLCNKIEITKKKSRIYIKKFFTA